MKGFASFALGVLLLVSPRAGAQGTIAMANYGINPQGQAWSEPIFLPDGVTPASSPYEATLYEGNSPAALAPVPGTTTVLGPGGLFTGPTITISGYPAGGFVIAQIPLWNSARAGSFAAALTTSRLFGTENAIGVILGSASAPGSLYAMSPITLQSEGVPEPNVVALIMIGGAFLCGAWTRRKCPGA